VRVILPFPLRSTWTDRGSYQAVPQRANREIATQRGADASYLAILCSHNTVCIDYSSVLRTEQRETADVGPPIAVSAPKGAFMIQAC
jgi:hypothetical protein